MQQNLNQIEIYNTFFSNIYSLKKCLHWICFICMSYKQLHWLCLQRGSEIVGRDIVNTFSDVWAAIYKQHSFIFLFLSVRCIFYQLLTSLWAKILNFLYLLFTNNNQGLQVVYTGLKYFWILILFISLQISQSGQSDYATSDRFLITL